MAGWPIPGAALPVFAPDGTIYTTRRIEGHPLELLALDPQGKPKPGWPVRLGGERGASLVAADDFLYATVCDAVDGCSLHRIHRDGVEPAPWPIPLPKLPHCSGPVIGPNGSVYATCSAGTDSSPLSGATVAFASSGAPLPGWPARIGGRLLEVDRDGTAYVASWTGGDVIEMGPPPALSVTAIGPSGRQRLGWPVAAHGELTLFDLLPGLGLYLGWWEGPQEGEAGIRFERTVFTVLRPDGSVAAGWPHTASGGSSPVLGDDGTLVYVTNQGAVYARDADGSVRRGWPVPGDDMTWGAWEESPLSVRPDGSIVVAAARGLTWLDATGRVRASWSAGRDAALSDCVVSGDTPCFPRIDCPVFGPDETAYLAVYVRGAAADLPAGVAIVAIDSRGHAKSGWPKAVPGATDLPELVVGPDGHVYVEQDGALTALTADGRLVR